MRFLGRRTKQPELPGWLDSHEPGNLALKQTIAWCQARADATNPKQCLRSAELAPRVLEGSYQQAVASVARSRIFELSHARESIGEPSVSSVNPEQLLAYFPNAELACGTAELETRGYFDVHNTPPWDTWIALFLDSAPDHDSYGVCLVSWVPSQFESQVDAGIEVNPEECIRRVGRCSESIQRQAHALLSPVT